jgi:hypothetical protein
MDILLRTNQVDPLLALRGIQRFADGSGYRVVLEVRSRDYHVRTPFYFESGPLAQFVDQLVAMDHSLKGSAKLKPLYEGHFIELALTHTGRVVVSGEVFEYSEHAQHLKFEFETDQTVLRPFIEDLKQCLNVAAA